MMKKRILSVGLTTAIDGVDNSDFFRAKSFTDYDHIIVEPLYLPRKDHRQSVLVRRAQELRDFFHKLGGTLVCYLRADINHYHWFPPDPIHLSYLEFDQESKRQATRTSSLSFPADFDLIARTGTTVGQVNKSHPFAAYFEGLSEDIQYDAVIGKRGQAIKARVIGYDRTDKIIAMDLPFGQGRVVLLPGNTCRDSQKLAEVLFACLEPLDTAPLLPRDVDWLDDFTLHGEPQVREKIQTIHDAVSKLEGKEQELVAELEGITKYKVLLWGKHKRPLEPVVRAALRLMGLNIFEEDAYPEDYDIYGKEEDLFIVGEVEGSKDPIDVKKFRQLLDYCQEEMDKDHAVKGLLIGNGLCEDKPETRGLQFTDRAIQRSESQGFCCLTTYALFKIVKAVLSNEMDESLKQKVKQGILATHGVFNLDKWLNSS